MARKHIAKKGALAAGLAVALTLGIGAGTAFAYYTDSDHASGMISFSYDPEPPTTEVEEYPTDGVKTVSVKNTGEVDAMVRVKIVHPTFPESWGVTINYEDNALAAGWVNDVLGRDAQGNDTANTENWWYYPEPLSPGEVAPAFKVEVTVKDAADQRIPAFDVVVLQQCTSAKGFVEGEKFLGTFADGDKYLTSFPDKAVVDTEVEKPVPLEVGE